MTSASRRRRWLLTWLTVCLLFALCGVLGFLQYRWIGEVSVAARERMRGALQASLSQLSQHFNSEILNAADEFVPAVSPSDEAAAERQIQEQYRNVGSTRPGLLHEVAIAAPRGQTVVLRVLNWQTGKFEDASWPPEWENARKRFEAMTPPPPPPHWEHEGRDLDDGRPDSRGRGPGGHGPGDHPPGDGWPGPQHGMGPPGPRPGPPPPRKGPPNAGSRPKRGPSPRLAVPLDMYSFEMPLAASPRPDDEGPGPPHDVAWMIVQLDAQYVREVWLPDLIRRDLNNGAQPDYEASVVTRAPDSSLIYESSPGQSPAIKQNSDASVLLFAIRHELPSFRATGNPGQPPDGRGPAPPPEPAHWEMTVRHRAGSLEAAVERTRRANLAVTGGVMAMMLAAIAALIRFTRRAQHLAQLQMDFVAGVSHELRTPLTVIHTAAYNLQGRLSADSRQVEKYGALIQKESGRLKSLVEQILRFSSAEAGQVIAPRRPVSMETVIDAALEGSRETIEASGCTVERHIDANLPPVPGDPDALQQVVTNLVSNAIKYGSAPGASNLWIGISAKADGDMLELRVADRGPGVPREELSQIFDPFFRGASAREAQVHGTGLGLTLVKKIVEAHGGEISLKSEPGRGTEFIVRLPTGSAGVADPETADRGALK